MSATAFLRSPRYAWVMVLVASVTLGLSFGTLVSLGVFLKPLAADFGWPRGVTSAAYMGATFLNGLAGIPAGYLADRYSTRPLIMVGVISMGAGLVLLSLVEALWQLYLLYAVVIGGFAAGSLLAPLLANVGFWFEQRRGLALGITLAGQSVGAASVPFVARLLISALDWRGAYLAMGVGVWVILVPLAFLVRDAPGARALKTASRAEAAGGNAAAPVASPLRLTTTLSIAIVFCCITMATPIIHVAALASDTGIPAEQAAGVLSVMMLASMVGRVSSGRIADSIGGIRTLLLFQGTQTAFIYAFVFMETLPGFYLIALLFGVGYGGVIPSYTIIVRELIPPHLLGRCLGIVLFLGNTGMGLGGLQGGFFYDLTGNYHLSYGVGLLTGLVQLTIVGSLYLYVRGRSQPALAGAEAA